jgi:predicted TIM-barrel fold metal-dependent hydrolase
MLIDIHAHFYTDRAGRADWDALNRRRLEAGRAIGITAHIASILGTYGARSPVYFPSPDDVHHANAWMLRLTEAHPGLVFGYCVVNPNFPDHALTELEARLDAGLIGVKLAASRRADDALLDPIAELAAAHDAPILHHVWQHRRREWPGQEASDASELVALAERHPRARFILAHLGGGGDWQHSLRVLRGIPNVWVDLSGSGIDGGMLEAALEAVGAGRLVWGGDVTLDTGLAKLRYLEMMGLPSADLAAIRHGNAERLFARGGFQ